MIALALFAAQAIVSVPVAAPPPAAAAIVDPARLPAARSLAARLVPEGAYQRMMKDMMPGLTGRMMDGMLEMPVRQLVTSAGVPAAEAAKLGSGTLRQVMAILDPAYDQRTRLTTQAMFEGMGALFATFEPEMREGVAEAYARRFDARQLAELNQFFQTPTGSAFAAQQMTVMNDPAVVSRMQTLMPALLKGLPDLMRRAAAATAGLPKQKRFADLSEDDRRKVAALLGADPAKLKDGAK